MYVCVCQAVTESQVRDAVRDGVHSMRALREHLGIATECGKCAPCAHGILKECRGCPNGEQARHCGEN
ncbi:MAG: (2Fe-2S)-binding protein [Hydrogenophilaceae bacterium]|nr:(2Fe-2S)-binding protein [Hydrogenophilaceae bacterium]